MYLIPADFSFQIRKEIKTLLEGQSQIKLLRAEQAAVSQMRDYLKRRYDIEKIFLSVAKYQETVTYQPSALVYFHPDGNDDEALVYECKEESVGHLPTDPTFFRVQDPRNQAVVMYAIDMLLYHLHTAISQRQIPEQRDDRYQDALAWLKAIAAGELEADLPIRPAAEQVPHSGIRFSSHPKENQRW